jgi:hypothetical protein
MTGDLYIATDDVDGLYEKVKGRARIKMDTGDRQFGMQDFPSGIIMDMNSVLARISVIKPDSCLPRIFTRCFARNLPENMVCFLLIAKPKDLKLLISRILVIALATSCSTTGPGFAGYDKPPKATNKYYSKNFDLSHKDLVIGKPYKSTGALLPGNNIEFYFVFYANGFVLHNSIQSEKRDNSRNLDYSKIHGEEVGSYTIKGDTLYWATKAGYMKKYNYYSARITETGLIIISQPEYLNIKQLTL